MASYNELLQRVAQKLSPDLASGGGYSIDVVIAKALAQLPALAQTGGLTPTDLLSCDALVNHPPASMNLDTREWISELNLAAAQALENDELVRQMAHTRCRVLHTLACQIDPATRRNALRRVTRKALDIATRYYPEDEDPTLVGDLNLQAGNVYMGGFGPVENDIDQGLQYFLRGYQLKQDHAPKSELAQLEQLMRNAATFLLSVAPLGELVGADLARRHQKLETAVAVFEAVGPPKELQHARFALLEFYIANRLLDAAEPLLDTLDQDVLQAPPELQQTLPLYRADWLSQRYRAQEALAILDPLFAQDQVAADARLYGATIRANCLLLNHAYEEAYTTYEG